MSITFYCNWFGFKEFIFIDMRLTSYPEDNQIGFSMGILGIGFVIICNI